MQLESKYDVVVIGAGPGGYVAAIRAAQLGKKVLVIEKDKPGGVCLNIGCIPSKSLIHQAQKVASIPDLEKMGIKVDQSQFSYQAMYKNSRKAAAKLSKGIEFLLKKNKIAYVNEAAVLQKGKAVRLASGKEIRADNIIIATGSRPREIPSFPFDEKMILSSTGALLAETLPQKIAIIGSGAIGIEFAYIYSALNVEVHLIEIMDQLLPTEDADIVDPLASALKKNGINIYLSSEAILQEIKKGQFVRLAVKNKKQGQFTLDVDRVLVAVGRVPNTDQIGLENIGLKAERGLIPVKDYYQTDAAGVFAIGDVINSPQLAHVASKEGEIAAEYIAGKQREKEVEYDLIPFAVYSEPQVASFGLKEKELQSKGIKYKKSLFPYQGCGKAVAVEHAEGFVKVITDQNTNEILAAAIVGHEATELLHEILLAKKSELLPEDIATMIHAHPTLSESVMEAMRAVDDWMIHV